MQTIKIQSKRRGGKTTLLAQQAVYLCATESDTNVLIVGTNSAEIDIVVEYIINDKCHDLTVCRKITSPYRMMNFTNGSSIRFMLAAGRLEGLKPNHLLVDDADHMNYNYVLGLKKYFKPLKTFLITYTKRPKKDKK